MRQRGTQRKPCDIQAEARGSGHEPRRAELLVAGRVAWKDFFIRAPQTSQSYKHLAFGLLASGTERE